jgi:hypothetical protein
MVSNRSRILKELLEEIEGIFDQGRGSEWSNNDFERLSERILEKTGKRLSITTLKRVWGRTAPTSAPSLTTLNILSEYAGYGDWRKFCKSDPTETAPLEALNHRSNRVLINGASLIVVVLIITAFLIFNFTENDPIQHSENQSYNSLDSIEFSFSKVTAGYPNTVIFKYDIGNLQYDSLAIQQSWDESKRISLSGPGGLVTGTYYSPGYFLTKLMVNDRIVREMDLYIPTEGWQGILFSGTDFTYLDPAEEIETEEVLRWHPETLEELNSNSNSYLYLANLSPNPALESSNFRLETEFRVIQPTKRSICQFVRMTITGTREVLSFQFGIPGCVGDLMFFLNKKMVSGRENDLSGFGLVPGRWASCNIVCKDNHLTLYVNGKKAFETQLASDIGKIGGVQWTFEGTAEIRDLNLTDGEHHMDLINK